MANKYSPETGQASVFKAVVTVTVLTAAFATAIYYLFG